MKKRNSQSLMTFFLMAGLLLAGGCKKEVQPQPPLPAKPVAAVKVPLPVQMQQSSAKMSENLAPSLDFSKMKDPFRPFVNPQAQVAKQGQPAAIAANSDLLPIQRYELSRFKVVGIIVGLKENRALVIDPDGKGYVVRPGMLIGSNNGLISKITPRSIEVVESYKDDGRIRKRISRLYLPQKK